MNVPTASSSSLPASLGIQSGENGGANEAQQRKAREPRVVRACDACRRKKIRCLGGSPEQPCAHCRAAGAACTFEERPTKRGPPKGYVESLERRLEAMEALLQSLSPSAAADIAALRTGGDGGDPAEGRAFENVIGASPDHTRRTSDDVDTPGSDAVDRLANDIKELSVDKDRYVGSGSGLHLAHSIRDFSDIVQPSKSFLDEETSGASLVEVLLQTEHRRKSHLYPLPPSDLSSRLVDAYFTQINPVTALLHRPSFDAHLAGGMLDQDASFRSLFFMVCAIGARFVEDDRIPVPPAPCSSTGHNQSRGFSYFMSSRGAASPSLVSATLFDIQCSVLGSIWLLGAATPIFAWAAVGFAIRRAVDVGAHRESRSRWTASPLEDQLRKRAFHALFGIDRHISASLGRPLAMQEEDTDLSEPLEIDDATLSEWDMRGPDGPPPQPSIHPTHVAGANSLGRLYLIMGRALRQLYGLNQESNSLQKTTEIVCELDSMLNHWLHSVPEHLRWNPTTQDPRWLPQSVTIYTAYYCCQILVHREFISPARAQLHTFPSLAICSNAARSCSHVLDTLRQRDQVSTAFYYAPLCAVTSGLILLINVLSNRSTLGSLTSSAMRDVKKNIMVLNCLAESTYIAGKCLIGLTKLATIALSPASARDPAAPSLKRQNPDYWLDADSPASSGPSTYSPPGSGEFDDGRAGAGESSSRRKVARHHSSPQGELPLTTEDLSLLTFNGRPTFAPMPFSAPPTIGSGIQQFGTATSLSSPPFDNSLFAGLAGGTTNAMGWEQTAALPQDPSALLFPDFSSTPQMRGPTGFPNFPLPQGPVQVSESHLAAASLSSLYTGANIAYQPPQEPFNFAAPTSFPAPGNQYQFNLEAPNFDISDWETSYGPNFDYESVAQAMMGSMPPGGRT